MICSGLCYSCWPHFVSNIGIHLKKHPTSIANDKALPNLEPMDTSMEIHPNFATDSKTSDILGFKGKDKIHGCCLIDYFVQVAEKSNQGEVV